MKSALYFMVIVLVLVAIGFVAFYINSSDKVSELEDQLTSMTNELSSIIAERNSATAEALDLTVQLSVLEQENAALQETIKPTKPTHNLSFEEVSGSSDYWNLAWENADLQQAAREVNAAYYQWHYYIEGETDCNDMAVDIWDMLRKRGILSLIAIGNLKMEDEPFAKCNHTWLVIISSSGKFFALEPTNGQLYFKGDSNSQQYMENFLYALPSDLRADAGSRW